MLIHNAVLLVILYSCIITSNVIVDVFTCMLRGFVWSFICSMSIILLFTFWMGVIQTNDRLLHCYLVKSSKTVTSETIFIYMRHWYCYLPVRVNCKPLRHGEISFKALFPEVNKGSWRNRWQVHTHKHTALHESFFVLSTLHPVSIRSFLWEKKKERNQINVKNAIFFSSSTT